MSLDCIKDVTKVGWDLERFVSKPCAVPVLGWV